LYAKFRLVSADIFVEVVYCMNILSAGKIRIAPPRKWLLPGDLTPKGNRMEIHGTARRAIAHALTYHGIPKNIDRCLNRLPSDIKLKMLSTPKKDYLAFLVYSLKQMVSVGTIRPETAWSLFYGEWENIHRLDEEYIGPHTQAFYYRLQYDLEVPSHVRRMDLLEFEFWARAGEAGLERLHEFDGWSKSVTFRRTRKHPMCDGIRQEYLKALWLEMRDIESRSGLGPVNENVSKFVFNRSGWFRGGENAVLASIELFNGVKGAQTGEAIDSTIKAEIGHWHLDPLDMYVDWICELKDRVNMSAFTPRGINSIFTTMRRLTPEQATFLYGGYFLQSGKEALKYMDTEGLREVDVEYPMYPREFPSSREASLESHEVAERVERLIRQKVIQSVIERGIAPEETYSMYWKTSLYVMLIGLENKVDGISIDLEEFDISTINEYSASFRSIAAEAWEKQLNAIGYGTRLHVLSNLRKLGQPRSGPALRRALKDRNVEVRASAAHTIQSIEGWRNTEAYKELYVFGLASLASIAHDGKWRDIHHEIEGLGMLAMPALLVSFTDQPPFARSRIRRLVKEIGGEEAVRKFNEAQRVPE